jgi:hypothetical protein
MSTFKEIGHFLKKNIKPELLKHNPEKLKSVALGSSMLKSIGHSLVEFHNKKHSGSGPSLKNDLKTRGHKILKSHLKKYVDMGIIKHNEKINETALSASDIFGKNWKRKANELLNKIDKLHQLHGEGVLEAIGKTTKKIYRKAKKERDKIYHKSKHTLTRFIQGKTKLKPSQLAGYIAGSLGIVAGIATLQPEVVGVSAGVIGGISTGVGGVAGILSTSGRGLYPAGTRDKPPPIALKFLRKYPEKALKIDNYVKNVSGSGLSKKKKKILKALGVVGLAGALSYLSWRQGQPTGEITIPQLDHSIPDDAYLGLGDQSGEGFKEIKKWVKNNKKKALAILMGTVVISSAVAGEVLFRKKYGGTSLASSDAKKIIKYILSGSDKKLELDKVMLRGSDVVKLGGSYSGSGVHLAGYGIGKMEKSIKPVQGAGIHLSGYGVEKLKKPSIVMARFIKKYPKEAQKIVELINREPKNNMAGSGIVSKIKSILALVGVVGIVGAYSFAKWYFNIRNNANLHEYRAVNQALSTINRQLVYDATLTTADIVRKLGNYVIGSGSSCPPCSSRRKKIGTKKEVWEGSSDHTSGGLFKKDLVINKRGKLVSKKQMENGRRQIKNLRNLQ